MCDRWLHPECFYVNKYELETFEQLDIPFMFPQCEWSENDLSDIEFDEFNNSGVQASVYVDRVRSSLTPPFLSWSIISSFKC